MFSSTIIATIARPTLARTVSSVLQQEFHDDELEVIVVNDSGKSLEVEEWQKDPRVQIVHTNRRGPQVAQNTGAAIAKGRYLHFLDDDDWFLPGGVSHLWSLSRRAPDADWLYGATQLVDRAGTPLIQLRHDLNGNIFAQAMAGEWIPLQSSFIKAETFMAIGGMNRARGLCFDVDLVRRISLRGTVGGTDELVACYMIGASGSSVHLAAEPTRAARENILDERGAFRRLQGSATSAYWRGRMARAYLTSMLWNCQHRHPFAASRRALLGAASVFAAAADLPQRDFWNGFLTAYESPTFRRGFDEAQRHVG